MFLDIIHRPIFIWTLLIVLFFYLKHHPVSIQKYCIVASCSTLPLFTITFQSYVQTLVNFKSFLKFLRVTTCFGQYGNHQVLKYI
jgi:hypothetical protein